MTLTVDYPESLPDAMQLTREQFETEARLVMAVKLFELGKVSSGTAARIADVPRREFLRVLSRYSVAMIQTTVEDLKQDLAHA